jgi:hypothetical protein
MGKQKVEKTTKERLEEGISLLKQVKEAGIKENTLSYQELKRRVSEWVKSGESWEDRMEFPEYGRMAEIHLPKYNNRAADILLKMKK